MAAADPLLARFFAGDYRALGRLLTLLEEPSAEAARLLAQVFPRAGQSYRVGLTGAPGAGKSTLVNRLTAQEMAAGHDVAVVAVDPSSPFTGGALLGDRIRFEYPPPRPGQKPAFFRSAATRGAGGGLTRGTEAMATLLEAFGYGRLLIETVGVGQVELDIARAADTTVVVMVPESGDDIQALKAGLIEIAHVVVVNKADRPGAESLRHDLMDAIRQRHQDQQPGWQVPVLLTRAQEGQGIAELAERIAAHREYRLERQGAAGLRKDRLRRVLAGLLGEELRRMLQERLLAGELPDGQPLEPALEAMLSGAADPFTLARDLAQRLVLPPPRTPGK